ncbi:MAG: STAS domain-containing protein [Gammaproteobacteria bacterium]|nr:STAS domain-containing protein [Gammaproteobacteria bacterium]
MPLGTSIDGNGVVKISISGRFDFNLYQEFRDAYKQVENPAAAAYEIDMSGADYMDSSALGMLLLLRERAGGDKANISITGCNTEIKKIFSISNFERLFSIS